MFFEVYFSAVEQRGVEIQLDPIRLTALLVGLVRLEQEVKAEGRRLIFSVDPITGNNQSTSISIMSRSSVSTISSLPSPTHFNVKAGLSTSVKLSRADQRRLQVI